MSVVFVDLINILRLEEVVTSLDTINALKLFTLVYLRPNEKQVLTTLINKSHLLFSGGIRGHEGERDQASTARSLQYTGREKIQQT